MSNNNSGKPQEFHSESGSLSRDEQLVVWLLRIIGVVVLSALIPVFFPSALMANLHEKLGLGGFPDQPISWYFARSLSLMYFAHGVIVFSLSTNIRRYWPLIKVLGFLNLALGIFLTGIDFVCQMPWWWTVVEGPSVTIGGVMLLLLIRRCDSRA